MLPQLINDWLTMLFSGTIDHGALWARSSVLLRYYAKRTRKADVSASAVIGAIAGCAQVIGSKLDPRAGSSISFGSQTLTLAGVEGLEPPTPGFGDRCSSH